MPCLLQRDNGFFYVVSTRRSKRVWRSLGTKDREEARRAFDEKERERKREKALTLGLFAADFETKASLELSGKTIAMYRGAFKNLIRIIGDKLMKKVSPLDVEAFKINRAKEIAPVSVNVELRSLRAAFREAKRLRLIDESPFEGVKQLRVPHKEGKCMTETEFWKLIEIMDPEFRNLIKFALYTVTRLGEIVSLRWDDVDLAARKIHIRSKADFRVKGGKPRSVPLHPWVSAFLESRKRQGEYVFTKSNGWPLQGPTVSRKLKRYLRKAGLDEGLHFHSLRHTGISWLQNRGVSPQFVQRIAGHSSLNVTQIYTHVHDESLFSAINAFGQPKI